MGLENQELGQYKLISLIGKGGMAEVWLANQMRLNREVAIKVIPDNLASGDEMNLAARFTREAHAIAHLDHPNILPVIDYGQDHGYLYLVMPYLRGGSLQERIRREVLTRGQVFDIYAQILSGVAYAHSRGIVHRDLKPANILLYDQRRSVIADFGVAKTLTENVNLTQTGSAVGSPTYMAPEQFRGISDFRSDLYSLGVILYQLLTGRPLYSGTDSWEIAMKHMNDPLPLPDPQIPPPLTPFLARALSKRPEDRFTSAGEMEAVFHQAIAKVAQPELMSPVPRPSTAVQRPRVESSPSMPQTAGSYGSPVPPVYPTPSTPGIYSGQMGMPSQTGMPPAAYQTYNLGGTAYTGMQTPVAAKKSGSLIWLIVGIVVFVIVAAGLGTLLLLGGNKGTTSAATTTAAVATTTSGSTSGLESLTVNMNSMNGTSVKATGVLTNLGNGKVKVEIKASNLDPGSHNVHIHAGTCLNQGAVQFPLTTMDALSDKTGISITTIEADYHTLISGGFYLNIHNQANTPTYVASCGEIAT